MNKVYGYCRVALKNDNEIAEQCKFIGDYCKDNGLTVDEYFCDNGVSGLKIERTGLSKLLDVLQKDDVVIIKDVARLSRNIHQYMTFARMIYKKGALLFVIDQPDLKFDEI
jgi:DNA invertase Pin-like site-specific DNA recombinase